MVSTGTQSIFVCAGTEGSDRLIESGFARWAFSNGPICRISSGMDMDGADHDDQEEPCISALLLQVTTGCTSYRILRVNRVRGANSGGGYRIGGNAGGT